MIHKSSMKTPNRLRKGDNGVVLILGGSELYTGAPLFSAKAALRSGSDLVFIMSPAPDLQVLKTLHEAIVLPLSCDKRILSKITACVIGPGLGRLNNNTLNIIIDILRILNQRHVPCIIDADAIHYYKLGHFRFLKIAVLTPNYKERNNLMISDSHICIFKDYNDLIVSETRRCTISTFGSPKRCGGQGDILSGILGTLMSKGRNSYVKACVKACKLVRIAANFGFKKKGFSLITSDIIEEIPNALKIFKI